MSNRNSHHTPLLMEVLVEMLLEIQRKTSFRGSEAVCTTTL